jgi:hypothetical protein
MFTRVHHYRKSMQHLPITCQFLLNLESWPWHTETDERRGQQLKAITDIRHSQWKTLPTLITISQPSATKSWTMKQLNIVSICKLVIFVIVLYLSNFVNKWNGSNLLWFPFSKLMLITKTLAINGVKWGLVEVLWPLSFHILDVTLNTKLLKNVSYCYLWCIRTRGRFFNMAAIFQDHQNAKYSNPSININPTKSDQQFWILTTCSRPSLLAITYIM